MSKNTNLGTHTAEISRLISEPRLKPIASTVRMDGAFMKRLLEERDLHSTELGYMLGVNSSALYKKSADQDLLSTGVSILLRCHAALPRFSKRIMPPDPEQLMSEISRIDPTMRFTHLGYVMGLERNSAHRLRESFEKGSQQVKVLAQFIWEAIQEDPSNWFIIKRCYETEAESRGIFPGSRVWDEGGWNRERED